MNAWREMMDTLDQAQQWETQLRRSLGGGQFTPQLAAQLDQTLRCQGLCRDKVRQWQRAFDQGQPGQTDLPEARQLSEEYLAAQRDLELQLKIIRQAIGRGGLVPAQFSSCRPLLDRLMQCERELCDLEEGQMVRSEMALVYAPPEYFFKDTLPKANKPAPSGDTQPYPKNFAVDSSEQDGFLSPQVQPVYAAPPRKEKK